MGRERKVCSAEYDCVVWWLVVQVRFELYLECKRGVVKLSSDHEKSSCFHSSTKAGVLFREGVDHPVQRLSPSFCAYAGCDCKESAGAWYVHTLLL